MKSLGKFLAEAYGGGDGTREVEHCAGEHGDLRGLPLKSLDHRAGPSAPGAARIAWGAVARASATPARLRLRASPSAVVQPASTGSRQCWSMLPSRWVSVPDIAASAESRAVRSRATGSAGNSKTLNTSAMPPPTSASNSRSAPVPPFGSATTRMAEIAFWL